ACPPALCSLRYAADSVPREPRQEPLQGLLAIPRQADFDRVTQDNARRIKVDLHGTRLAWLGQELDVGERGAHHQESVTMFHGLLRRPRPEQTNTAGRIRAVVDRK